MKKLIIILFFFPLFASSQATIDSLGHIIGYLRLKDTTLIFTSKYRSDSIVTAIGLKTAYTLHSPIEGATVNLVKNSFNIIDLSTIKTSLILNFPPNPTDKDFVEVKFTLAVTTVTYTGGVIKGGYVAPIAGTTIKFSFVQSNNTWY